MIRTVIAMLSCLLALALYGYIIAGWVVAVQEDGWRGAKTLLLGSWPPVALMLACLALATLFLLFGVTSLAQSSERK